MKRRGLIFLLLSGFVLVCHLQTDRFHAVSKQSTWTEAQRHCRKKFTDLATIKDQTNNDEARQTLGSRKFWIGLFFSSWKWSREDRDVSKKTWFTSWAPHEPRPGKCVTISGLGRWSTRDCGAKHHMICYNAEYNKHILVTQLMSWTEAQTYCRSKYTDLSSIRSQEDNEEISSLLQSTADSTGGTGGGTGGTGRGGTGGGAGTGRTGTGRGTGGTGGGTLAGTGGGTATRGESEGDSEGEGTNGDTGLVHAWIGLYRQFWLWSDRSGASYRRWAAQQPDERADCVVMDSSGVWYSRPCSEKHSFLCSTDVRPSVLRSMKVRLSGGSADLNDPTLQDAILQQLKQKLEEGGIREEVKLRWRRQPDGKVFHREEEERAPPGGWEEEGVCVTL